MTERENADEELKRVRRKYKLGKKAGIITYSRSLAPELAHRTGCIKVKG